MSTIYFLCRNIIPENLFHATFAQTQTKYKRENIEVERNTTNGTVIETQKQVTKYLGTMGNPNIIGMCCFLIEVMAGSRGGQVVWTSGPPPPGIARLLSINFCHVEIFRQTPSAVEFGPP